jgi:hypothetical protein
MIKTPTKAGNVRDYRARDDAENRLHEYRQFLLPYLIMAATQLPLVVLYLRGLWIERPHYRLLPVAFAGCGLFLYRRWPRVGEPVFFSSTKSDLFLAAAVVTGLLATIFLSPWAGYAALLCVLASLLARTNDRQIFGTLLAALVPLAVLLQPPVAIDFDTVQGDVQLLAFLDTAASTFASDCLDLMGYPHNIAGHRMEFPVGEFSATELGNGTLSVYTLLILTGLFVAWQRMPMFRGFMLLAAACFWFMTFEAVALMISVIGETSFEKDYYSPGPGNRVLQIGVLLLAGLLTALSERLLAFLFGPVDIQAIDENVSWQDRMCRFWNAAIAGVTSPVIDINVRKQVAWAKRRNSLPTRRVLHVIRYATILLAICGAVQLAGVAGAWSQQGESFLASGPALRLESDLLPDECAGLMQTGFTAADRGRLSVYEGYHQRWVYEGADEVEYVVWIEQPFSGWHDFDLEFRSEDWKREGQPELSAITVADESFPAVQANYQNNLAQHRVAWNAQIDGFTAGFEVPLTWTSPAHFFQRLASRPGNRTRPRLFSGYSLQISVFADTIGPPPEAVRQQVAALFHTVVGQVVSYARQDRPSPDDAR